MMFENITTLYYNYTKFLLGETYEFQHANVLIENWAQQKAGKIDDSLMSKSWS